MAFAALAPLIGGAVAGIGNLLGQSSNADQAKSLYRHRYQWQVEDMKRAGLNPALAYGQNAPIPQTQPIHDLGSEVVRGASAAAAAQQTKVQTQLTAAQAALLNAQAADIALGTKLKNDLLRAQIATESERPLQIKAQTSLAEQQRKNLGQVYLQLAMETQFQSATWESKVAQFRAQARLQGINITRAQAEAELAQLRKPGAQAEANLFNTIGAGGTNSAIQLLRLLVGVLK